MPLVRKRKEQHSLAHLYNTSSPTLHAVVALRLRFRLRLSYGLNHFQKTSEASQQADNLAKLWCGVLSVYDLIAQIIGAVEKQKPIVAFGIVQPRNSVAALTAFAPAR